MRPRMPDCGVRYIMQTISPINRAPAEIHIFEPQGKKAFVKGKSKKNKNACELKLTKKTMGKND